MTEREARNKLIHARLWLLQEQNAGWATAGVYFALVTLDNAKVTFFTNAPHRSKRCMRCAEIVAMAWLRDAPAGKVMPR